MVLRCYAELSDLIREIFGTSVPWLPIRMYGFFVGLAVLTGAYFVRREFLRMQRAGILVPHHYDHIVGRRPRWHDLVLPAILGFLIGYKILGFVVALMASSSQFQTDAAGYLLSGQGNIVGGLVVAALLVWLKFREIKKAELPKPKRETAIIWPHQQLGKLIIIAFIAGLIGSKLFSFLEDINDFHSFLNDPITSLAQGHTIFGALIFGGLAIIIYGRRKGIPPLRLLDALAPAIMLAAGVGRLGCHVSGDGDWGIENTLDKPGIIPSFLWNNHYAHNVIDEGILMADCTEKHCQVLATAVFPTPLYELAIAIIFFGVLWYLRKRLLIPGLLFALYLVLTGFARFWIEKIRINLEYQIWGIGITQAEIVSIVLMGAGLIMAFWVGSQYKKSKTPDM